MVAPRPRAVGRRARPRSHRACRGRAQHARLAARRGLGVVHAARARSRAVRPGCRGARGGGGDAAPRGPARAVPDLSLGQDPRRVRRGVDRGRGRADGGRRLAHDACCRGGGRIGRRHRGRVLRHRGDAPHPARHTAPRALEAPARLDRRLGGALRAGDGADRVHLRARGRRGSGVLRRPADRRAPELRHARPPGAADRRAGGLERPARGSQRAAAAGEHQLRGSHGAGARLARQLHSRPLRRGCGLLTRHRAGGGPAGGGGHRDPPGRPRPRHRQDRPARGAAREAVGPRRRRVGRDARAPGDRGPDPRPRWRTTATSR